ncbi:MAG: glycerophosphodiester phosphodiesterase family protein [Clostridia bacterium]|nr:glycerophosphodiester phosphodiesterase family protein [Clostridia bacterium]
MKKLTALLLALIMLMGAFTACANEPANTNTNPVTNPATEPETEPESEAATEPDTTVRIGRTPLSEYVVVYGEGYEETAKELAARFEAICGSALAVKPESEAKSEHEIAIFAPARGASAEGLGMDDFKITKKDGTLNIVGGSVYATDTACAKLLDLFSAEKYAYELSDVTVSYTLPDRQEYINDLSKLALHWEFYFETPEWMLDFDEKYAAFNDPDGRLMSCHHRGEMVYYPENSIEGLISAVMMGADMVEIDPRVTKDGVFVLLHDATLSRTTDFAEKAGKNGLPESPNLADWTYDQLMQLNLKMGQGGDGAAVTPYKIPTLDEAIKICANNLFVRLDVKEDANGKIFWEFDRDIWPLLEKHKAYTTVICTWHSAFVSSGYKFTRELRERTEKVCGKPILNFMKNASDGKMLTREITSYDLCYAMRLTCNFSNYSYKTFLQTQAKQLSSCKGTVRVYADVHNTNPAYPENCESPEFFMELYEAGINLQLTNHGFMMCKLIAEKFSATEY